MAQTRKQVRRNQQAEAQSRNAAARAAAARAARRRKQVAVVGGVVAVGAVAAAAALLLTGGDGNDGLPHPTAALREVPPPWPAPAHPIAAAKAAGLRVNPMEGTALHFHAHLDVIVDGKPVTVPANIGIDPANQQLAEVHTHDGSGVIHIEAPDTKHRYVLGQVFTEWDVRLDGTHLGGLTAGNGKTLTAYVNGKRRAGDPADIELTKHEEIALVYGKAGAKVDVPKKFTFPEGE